MTLHPDLALSRRFLAAQPPPGRPVFCAVSGAHLYGFPSADSDLDLKGAYLAPTRRFLGLSAAPSTHDLTRDFEGTECDLTLMELGHALRLMLKGNGNVAEQMLSPYQLVESEELEALRQLLRASLSRRFHHHYRGFFHGKRREHLAAARPEAKTLLYSFRVVLSGIHLLERGAVCADIVEMADTLGVPDVMELVELKRAGDEHGELPPLVDQRLQRLWPELETRLQRAFESTSLPDDPANEAEVEAWLVARRLEALS